MCAIRLSPLPVGAVLVAALLPFCASQVQAVTLGSVDLRSYAGQPLDVRIPIDATPGENVELSCFSARAGSPDLIPITAKRFRLDQTLTSRTLIVRTFEIIPTTSLTLEVTAQCDGQTGPVVRTYQLSLPSLPLLPVIPSQDELPVASATPARTEPRTAPSSPGPSTVPASPAAVPGKAVPVFNTWNTRAGDTLQGIAAGIYPQSAALRKTFLDRLRTANPPLPADDAPLQEGLQIALPDLVAIANDSPRLLVDSASTLQPAPLATQPLGPDRSKPSPAATVPAKVASKAERPKADKETRQASAPVLVSREERSPMPQPASRTTPQTRSTSSSNTDLPPTSRGFSLRLSGTEMDMSRSRGVTEATRSALRDKQLILDADDQVAALLSLKNTVKQLESRLSDLQLKLSTSTAPQVAASGKVAEPVGKPPTAPQTSPTVTVTTPAPAASSAAAPPPSAATASVTPAPVAASPVAAAPPAAQMVKPETAAASAPVASATTAKPAPVKAAPAQPAKTVPPEPAWWENIWAQAGMGSAVLVLLLAGWAVKRRSGQRARTMAESASTEDHSNEDDGAESTPKPGPKAASKAAPDNKAISASLRARLEEVERQASTQRMAAVTPSAAPAPTAKPGRDALAETLPMSGGPAPDDAANFFGEDLTASLELDTRPATSVDFMLGEDNTEDKARRLRYMEERYPELANRSISVDEPDSIIDTARHHFEDGQLQKATELLTYAFEERPGQLRFWLALFEIYRLEQRTGEFSDLAGRFKNVHGGTDAWPKVQHIGRDLDPSNPLYSAALGRLGVPIDREFDPVAENWLNVPMDFTSDALMIELRHALLVEHGVDTASLNRLPVEAMS